MKQLKRILCVLLICCMVIATPIEVVDAATVNSGSCGRNLTWTLNDKGELSIAGTGVMYFWGSESSVPWHNQRESVRTISLDPRITVIAGNAFINCHNLTQVVIPEGITTIGDSAFENCSNLIDVSIPNSVTRIDTLAFEGTPWLKSLGDLAIVNNMLLKYQGTETNVTIPKGITKICSGAFHNCVNLTSVNIPESIIEIGSSAFQGCSNLTNISIPQGITTIDGFTFRQCTNLVRIHIPDSVSEIYTEAFSGCSNLTSINIPDSVELIGAGAFANCGKLGDIYYSGSESQWNKIEVYPPEGALSSALIHYNSSESDNVDTDWQNHRYQVFDGVASRWEEAENYCKSLGGHLAAISCQEENDFIYQLMIDAGYRSAYFGLTDCRNEGNWEWVTKEPVLYTNWHLGEPNSENGNEDYAMFYYKYPDGTWNDGDFGGHTVNGGTAFICEWDNGEIVSDGDFRVTANSASTCLAKGSLTEMYIGYYEEDSLDLSTHEYIYTLSDSNVLDIKPGRWSDEDGQHFELIAKETGNCVLTITHPQSGKSNSIKFRVVEGGTGYSFNEVPEMTIEQGKTTNFYDHKGLVVDEFAYTPNKDASGNIVDYTVTMTVYNTRNLYGAVSSFDAEGNLHKFDIIQKHESMSTDLVGNVIELINRTGDLFYQLGNSRYYSGKGISQETKIKLKVPVGGYLEIGNDASSAAAILANTIGLVLEGTNAAVDLGTSADKLLASETKIVKEAVTNCLIEDYTYHMNKAIVSTVKSQAEKALKNTDWNFDNFGSLFQSFLSCLENFGIDIVDAIVEETTSISGIASITESMVRAGIPTGKLIDFLYNTVKLENFGIFCANFTNNIKGSNGIYIYAPAIENTCTSNGVEISLPEAFDDSAIVHAYLVTDAQEFNISNATFPNDGVTTIGRSETYNITMYKNGSIIQPEGLVTVRIPLSEEMLLVDKTKIKVYRYNNDGTISDMDARIIDRYAVFTTDHFSYYSIVETVRTDTPSSKTSVITFNPVNGITNIATLRTGTDGKLSSLPIPIRNGYMFEGWYTASEGGMRINIDTVFTKDTILYARWIPLHGRITISTTFAEDNSSGTTYTIGGETVTLRVYPDTGYHLSSIQVIGPDRQQVLLTQNGNTYTFAMPMFDVTVCPEFTKI